MTSRKDNSRLGISTVLTTLIILVASVVVGMAIVIFGTDYFESQKHSNQIFSNTFNYTTVIVSYQPSTTTYKDMYAIILKGTLISHSVTDGFQNQPVIRLKIKTDDGIKNVMFPIAVDLSIGAYNIVADDRYFSVNDTIVLANHIHVFAGCANILLQYHDGTTATYDTKNFTLKSVPAYKDYQFIDKRNGTCNSNDVSEGYELDDQTQVMQWAAHDFQLTNETGIKK